MPVRLHILLAFLLCHSLVFAQYGHMAGQEQYPFSRRDDYRFSRVDITQGLSHNEVNCFLRDAQGFLWVGTMSGLDRFDSYKFKVFKHDLRDTTSISDDYIEKIVEGPGQKIWVYTRNGINIYDPLTERFDRNPQVFLQSIGIPNGNQIGNVTDIKKDSLGNYWFVSSQTGIYKYDPVAKTSRRYYYHPGDATSLYSANVASIALDADGNCWIIYKEGVIDNLNSRTGAVTLRSIALQQATHERSLNYQAYCDRQGDCWFYANASSMGAFYFNVASGTVKHIDKGTGPGSLNTNIVTGIIQDEKGKIWISTDHGGINLLDKRDMSIRYIMNRESDAKSISQNSINTVYQDKEGIIWIGTYKKGISYYHTDIMKFPLYRGGIADAKNLSYDDVNRFVEDAKGNLWIGTNGGGLLYFNRQTGKYTQYLHNPSNPNSLTNDIIVCLCLDHEQKLWIGTYFGGLDCFDGKSFKHYRHSEKDTSSIADDRVWELLEDSHHRFWIGTFAQGLDQMDPLTHRFTHYKPLLPNSVQCGYVTGLMEDHKGDLWIATAYGIDVLDNHTGIFRHYGHDNDHPTTSLSNNNTFSTHEDSRHLIWVTTREGLDLLDPATGIFRTFRTEDGLPDNNVLDIEEDSDSNLWLSSPNGLCNVLVSQDPATHKISCRFRNYDESDGLQGREFNENASYRTAKGELIFGGAYGFNIFDPRLINHDPIGKPLTLTDFQVFNNSVSIGQELHGRIILPQAVSRTSDITLPYHENVIGIEFAALDFANPEKVKYSYMLDGFHSGWLRADNKTRKATFTNLDPGNYTFLVRTGDDKGGWNPVGLSLHIHVLPPFWRTPLAYTLYGLLLIAALLTARRVILQRARMRFAIEQERKEAQRLHELDMLKIRFFTNVSHEFRTPLSLILTPLDKLIRDTNNPGWKNQFRLIHRNARRLLNMVNQLLDFRKLEEHELKLNLSKGDLIRFVRELSYSFADMAEKKHIDFTFHSHISSLETCFDPDKVERILFNLLSNAFKFTPSHGRIRVTTDLQPTDDPHLQGILQLSVQDSGIGIDKEKQEKIFDRFFQDDIPGSMVNQGSGIGLAITREFIKLHGGQIQVESEPGKGSRFIVGIPARMIGEAEATLPVLEEVPFMGEEQPIVVAHSEMDPEDARFSPAGEQPAAEEHPKMGAELLKKPTILIVEDSEDLRSYLKDNLREWFQIVEAANGKEGWQKTLACHPDLILCDIHMPEMNGVDLCHKIKGDKRTSFVPVILLTALTGEEQQLRGLETGANDYLTKPFNFDILLSRIRNQLVQQETSRRTWQKQVDASPTNVRIDSPDEKFIRQALEIVEKNLSNPDFSVVELSRALFLSRVSLYKKLFALTGKTPIEFIRSIRLKRAAQLLGQSQFTVAEIAYEVGFNNPKYFSRYFKTAYGMLPSAYQLHKRQEIAVKGH